MKELATALAKAQGEFKPIEKNRAVVITTKSGGQYHFRYADLEEILTKTRPALTANGLALIQTVEIKENVLVLTCKLLHAAGDMITSELPIPSAKEMAADPKAFGAAITYFRRYMVTAMLGVAADDDLDEDGQGTDHPPATGKPSGQKPAVTQPQRKAGSNAGEAKGKPAQTQEGAPAAGTATAGEIAYITKKITGAGMTIAQAREAAGLAAGDSLEGLTRDGFVALKESLA